MSVLHDARFDQGIDLLQHAPASIARAIVKGAARRPALDRANTIAWIDQLIEAGAWSEAALALIEFEQPQWKLRRLAFEDGKWMCSLSKQPNLPAGLDDTADASHEVLALAILSAFFEAHRMNGEVSEISAPKVLLEQPAPYYTVCCDNFF